MNVKAVVDERLRVKQTRGLRVADASIMPFVVSGNKLKIVLIRGFQVQFLSWQCVNNSYNKSKDKG